VKFLNDAFLEWMYGIEDRRQGEVDDLYNALEIWKHAQELLRIEDSPLYRADCIINLKRAVNVRLKNLEKIYFIKGLPSDISSKKTLDKFEELGLIRPNILSELIDIRNLIEHEETEPPSKEKCFFYIDIIWYFLKSTDSLVDDIIESFVYLSEDGNNRIVINIELSSPWIISASGKMHKQYFSNSQKRNTMELEKEVSFNDDGYTDLDVSLKLNEYYLKRIATEYFGLCGFWHEDRA